MPRKGLYRGRCTRHWLLSCGERHARLVEVCVRLVAWPAACRLAPFLPRSLYENNICDEGAKALGEALKSNRALTKLEFVRDGGRGVRLRQPDFDPTALAGTPSVDMAWKPSEMPWPSTRRS